jgi:hypothetical protein
VRTKPVTVCELTGSVPDRIESEVPPVWARRVTGVLLASNCVAALAMRCVVGGRLGSALADRIVGACGIA